MFDAKNIIKRLKHYLNIESNEALAEKLGVDKSTISSWKSRNTIKLPLIIKKVEGIDYNWLINGEKYLPTPNYIDTKDFIKKRDKNLTIPVILIPEKAKAGYLSDFSTDSVAELPIFTFKDYKNGHKYRAFEIEGDSMETTLYAQDIILCEKIEHTQYLKPHEIYILHTMDGLLCKRFEKQDDTKFIFQSDNVNNYSKTIINSEDIMELWKVVSLHRQF